MYINLTKQSSHTLYMHNSRVFARTDYFTLVLHLAAISFLHAFPYLPSSTLLHKGLFQFLHHFYPFSMHRGLHPLPYMFRSTTTTHHLEPHDILFTSGVSLCLVAHAQCSATMHQPSWTEFLVHCILLLLCARANLPQTFEISLLAQRYLAEDPYPSMYASSSSPE